MDNLKYYNDSFAYDYERFAPSVREKKSEILEYPNQNKKARQKRRAVSRKSAEFVKKVVISVFVLTAVFGSLFLRAEISSIKSQINTLDKEIIELESESTRLGVEIERKISVTNLEKAAIELGMQKCEKNQVTYIKTNEFDTAKNADGELTANLE